MLKKKFLFIQDWDGKQFQALVFIGRTTNKPFRSDDLNLVTMIMFVSHKSKQHRKDFENTDIIFELKENQLW